MNLKRRLTWLEQSMAIQPKRWAGQETLFDKAQRQGIDLCDLQQKLGLPLPPATPKSVLAEGAQLLRKAVASQDFEAWDEWAAKQHEQYGE